MVHACVQDPSDGNGQPRLVFHHRPGRDGLHATESLSETFAHDLKAWARRLSIARPAITLREGSASFATRHSNSGS